MSTKESVWYLIGKPYTLPEKKKNKKRKVVKYFVRMKKLSRMILDDLIEVLMSKYFYK